MTGTTVARHDQNVDWDAVIIGAGPAGSVAALELARRGHRVLLLDRKAFPRDKVCGGCLNSEALAMLRTLELGPILDQLGGATIHGFSLWAGRQQLLLPLPVGLAVSRSRLDAALVEAAVVAGAKFQPETHAIVGSLQASTDRRDVEWRQGTETCRCAAKVVIVASGLSGDALGPELDLPMQQSANSRIGVQTTLSREHHALQAGTISMAVGRHGYVGLTVLEDGVLNIAAAVDVGPLKQFGPAALCNQILTTSGIPSIPDLSNQDWQGTVGVTRLRKRFAAERLFVIGDAAGYIEPFTGEGMAAAIRGAVAVVPLVTQGIQHWDAALIKNWNHTVRRLVSQRQWVCRGLSLLLRAPLLVRLGMSLARTMPRLGRHVIQVIQPEPTYE